MKAMHTALLICSCILFAPGAPAQQPAGSAALAVQMDEAILKQHLGQWWGAVMVGRGGEAILAKGYGLADERLLPITADSLLDIGSVSKQFTAAAVLRLEARGLISTGDAVAKFYPDLQGAAGERAKVVTLHHLLTHTSGMSDEVAIQPLDFQDRDEAVQRAMASRPKGEPGAQFEYCNAGYIVAAAVVEKATGKRFEEVVRDEVFVPAGMMSTGFLDGEGLDKERATARVVTRASKERQLSIFADPMGEPWAWGLRGAGGVLTTANDLLKWERALAGETVLDGAAKAKLWNVEKDGYALGWQVGFTPAGVRKVHHGGGTRGYTTMLAIYPAEEVVIAVLTNERGRPDAVLDLMERLLFPSVEIQATIFTGALKLDASAFALFETGLSARTERAGERVALVIEHAGSPVARIEMSGSEATGMGAQLEQMSKAAKADVGVGGFLGVRPYMKGGAPAEVSLPEGLVWNIMPRYQGRGRNGESIVDERVTAVLRDEERGFWPVILKLDRNAAVRLAEDLRKAAEPR